MAIYHESGYVNMANMFDSPQTFNFVVGGRGTGKTYGALQEVLKRDLTVVFMRTRKEQIDMVTTADFNPFQPFIQQGEDIIIDRVRKGIYGAFRTEEDGSRKEHPFCYFLALSTISNLRGFSLPNVTHIIYDEFIPEAHERALKEGGKAFLNAYETINRNRELQGEKPVKAILLSNSEQLANQMFTELKLVTIAEKMVRKNIPKIVIPERDIAIYMLNNSKISEQKKETALYRLAGEDSQFSRMAISNDFIEVSLENIGSKDLRDFNILVEVGEICIYSHKSKNEFYVTDHKRGSCESFGTSLIELKRFRKKYAWLWFAYLRNELIFEQYIYQVLFERYNGII